MTTIASIAELQGAGVTFEVGETVAIAQLLICSLRGDETRSTELPYGPLTGANIFLNEDGSVTWLEYEVKPAAVDVAIFVEGLLSATLRVPGGLRDAVARARRAVDVAPFDSLEEFSEALARYETGPREDLVRGLLQRSPALAVATPLLADRRKPRVSASELRRALRDADERLYHWRTATIADAGSPAAPRDRTMPAAAAGVVVGVLLIASGEFMHGRFVLPSAAVDLPRSVAPAAAVPRPAEPVSLRTSSPPSPVVLTPARLVTAKPSSRRPRVAADASARPAVRRGVLDRLRLGWLRKAFKG
jgi:hypothetical protein